MREIYLLRHCETERTARKRCIGMTDVCLSDSGILYAQRLQEYFADQAINRIFCSDAQRAVKTAEIIAAKLIPVTVRKDLHEINMGDWDGMYFDEIQSKFPDVYRQRGLHLATFMPPNGECFADCQTRAMQAFCDIIDHTAGSIVVVAHAGFNRALICGLCHMDLQQLFTISQPFGCVNILSVQNGVCYVRDIGRDMYNGGIQ